MKTDFQHHLSRALPTKKLKQPIQPTAANIEAATNQSAQNCEVVANQQPVQVQMSRGIQFQLLHVLLQQRVLLLENKKGETTRIHGVMLSR